MGARRPGPRVLIQLPDGYVLLAPQDARDLASRIVDFAAEAEELA